MRRVCKFSKRVFKMVGEFKISKIITACANNDRPYDPQLFMLRAMFSGRTFNTTSTQYIRTLHAHARTHTHTCTRARGRAVEARWRLLSCLPSGTSSTGIVRILLSRVHACTCEHNAAQHTTRRTSYNFGYVIARVGD